ncbi:MAG: TrmH family RNA methyltransferase [Parvicella sp.]
MYICTNLFTLTQYIKRLITNEQIKLIKSLSRKTERRKLGLFVVEGVKNIQELLNSNYEIQHLFVTVNSDLKSDLVDEIGVKEMGRMTHLKNASNALAVVKIPVNVVIDINKSAVVLDRINDPGNLGTVIRTANWFGIDQIVCSEDSVDCYNSKVVMSTMGSLFKVKVVYTDLKQFFKNTKLPSYAAVFDGVTPQKTMFENQSNIVMGSESHGLDAAYLEFIENKVTIPGNGSVESLNLSISFGIICAEYYNQLK